MGRFSFRKLVSCLLLLFFPASLLAADTGGGMLYTNGSAWVNGARVPRASFAVFAGDLVQTRSASVANINAHGSSITVLSDSLVQFQGSFLKIEHGGVTVSTSTGIATTAGDVKVSPAANSWTEFNVSDVDGTVRIAARRGDLTIDDGKETVTLAQGQETTRDDSADQSEKEKKSKKRGTGAVPAAGGGVLNSPLAIGIGAGAIVGLTLWVLLQNDEPVSPSVP